jgi:hypothetical protein
MMAAGAPDLARDQEEAQQEVRRLGVEEMAVVPRDGARTPPPCPKCGESQWRREKSGRGMFWRCQPCRIRKQRAVRTQRSCPLCHKRLPHKSRQCPVAQRLGLVAKGRRLLDAQWPGYSAGLGDDVLERIGRTSRGALPLPRPSERFPGLLASLDDRLIRDGLETNVEFGQVLATLKEADQREYVDLYRIDPADANLWASLPKWKRVIRRGDKNDRQIWKFFVGFRLNMELLANPNAPGGRSMASQGRELCVWAGALSYLTDVRRLTDFLSEYGSMLANGEDMGDVTKPPWEVA